MIFTELLKYDLGTIFLIPILNQCVVQKFIQKFKLDYIGGIPVLVKKENPGNFSDFQKFVYIIIF